jgi:uncharacterized membrane protein
MADQRPGGTSISAGRWALAALFVVAGTLHFIVPAPYIRIMPPALPHPALLVAISGAAEICGGLGLLLPLTRRAAAIGLALLLLAVLPANWHMAVVGYSGIPGWALWLRIPLQLPLLWWALLYARR